MKAPLVMRRLRAEYGITLQELADTAATDYRLISKIELGKAAPNSWRLRLVQRGFEGVIARRAEQNRALARRYAACKSHLLQLETEEQSP